MNFCDYFYGGGEGCVLIGCFGLVIFWGKFVFGFKICKWNKFSN